MANPITKEVTKRLIQLNKKGYIWDKKSHILSAKYVFRKLEECPEPSEDFLNKLRNCRIYCNTIGEKEVCKRELIKLGLNPTDKKFFSYTDNTI